MVTTLLDRLDSLVSRQFVVGFFIPVLVFSLLNALLLAWQSEAFRTWAPAQFEGFKGLFAVPILIGLAVFAYLLSAVNAFLRQVLEGRRLLPDGAMKKLAASERNRRVTIEGEYQQARNETYAIRLARPRWRQSMIDAGDRGHCRPVPGAGYDDGSRAARLVAGLSARRKRAEDITAEQLSEAVTSLCEALERIDRSVDTPASTRLQADYFEMLELLDYAESAWDARRLATLSRLDTRFGVEELRWTRMGNVAAALDSYARTRYRMNLETFWNRMLAVLQEEGKFYGILLDAKCQLDFLVVSCWLSLLTGVGWLLSTPWLSFSWPFYLLVCLLAPLAARFFYELAVENYLVFADLVKSAVDLFRFKLLESLHMPEPSGLREERALWTALQEISVFGKEGLEISFRPEAP